MSLFKKTYTRYMLEGKQCSKATPGAKKVKARSKTWYGRYIDDQGIEQEVALSTDKGASRLILNEKVKKARLAEAGVVDPFEEHSKSPAVEHVSDFKAFLQAKGNTAKHVTMTTRHVEDIISACGVVWVREINSSEVMEAVANLRKAGKSLRTCNAHLVSIKAFTRWLLRDKRIGDDALVGLSGFNESTDRRHERREFLQEEINWLLKATEGHTLDSHSLPGPDRAMLYRLALGTGFRLAELRSLMPESFDLEGEWPVVVVEAAYAKNRKQAVQPINHELANMLHPWLATKVAGVPIFQGMTQHAARMLRTDLTNARKQWIKAAQHTQEAKQRQESEFLTYRNAEGLVIDFHSFRHTFISSVVAGGASAKTAQTLARHTTSRLTLDRYSHARLFDLQGAVQSLPSLTTQPDAPSQEVGELRATGTDHHRADDSKAISVTRKVTRTDGNSCLSMSTGIGNMDLVSIESEYEKTLEITGNSRVSGERRWSESNRRWRICNPLP